MVRLIGILIIIETFISCIRLNEYGFSRIKMSKFNIKTQNINSIDTNCIYKLSKTIYKNATGMQECEYLKFFSNQKVGRYQCFEIENDIQKKIFESKKGQMGYFYLKGDIMIVKFHFNNWHGSGVKTDTLKVFNDSLIGIHRGVENSEIIYVFTKEYLSKDIKITKPDW